MDRSDGEKPGTNGSVSSRSRREATRREQAKRDSREAPSSLLPRRETGAKSVDTISSVGYNYFSYFP